jgi:hypothetical protein
VHYSVTCLIDVFKVYKVTNIDECGKFKSYTWLSMKFETLNKYMQVFIAIAIAITRIQVL